MMPSPARRLVAHSWSKRPRDAGPVRTMKRAAYHRRDRRRTQRCPNFRIVRDPTKRNRSVSACRCQSSTETVSGRKNRTLLIANRLVLLPVPCRQTQQI